MAHLIAHLTSVSRHRRPGGGGQRSLAALLSATLVLGALLPGAAFATEADSEGEGSAPPEELAEPGEEPEFEPEGEETVLEELPAALGAQPGGGAEDTGEGPPVEEEPPQDPEAPPPAEVTGALPDEVVEVEVPEPAQVLAEETAAPEPELAAPPPEPEAAAAAQEPVEKQPLVAPPSPPAERVAQSSSPSEAQAPTEATLPVTPPAESEAPPPRPVATAPEPESGGASLAGSDSHTVRPGESLWSIAEALLPPGAGNAEIAKEVQRLWRLNQSRIGTGDPDLLPVGVELRLP